MRRWPTKPLEEIAEIFGGSTPSRNNPAFWGGDIHWVTPTDLPTPKEGISVVTETKDRITKAGLDNSSARLVPKGAVLFSSRATIGKVAIAGMSLATNQGFSNFVPCSEISSRFLAYSLWNRREDIARLSSSTTFKEVSRSTLRKYQIHVPPLAEQERIVKLLDEADELRKLRAQADRRTTALLPALFQEMFGSPATNPLAWPIESVGSLFDGARGGAKCGPFGSALKKHEYVETGVPVWGIPNVLPNQFVEAASLFISEKKFNELSAYAVQPGDLLFSRAGTVGRICVATPTVKDSIMGSNLIRLALDRRKVVPEFFSTLMTFFAKDVGRLRANIDEGAYSFMNTTVLKTLRIYVPPLPLQKEFAQRVTEIREMEAAQAASRRRLEDLFQSLLHRVFDEGL